MPHFSIFDLFVRGIGPSSSHTVGPMKAAQNFSEYVVDQGLLFGTSYVEVHLYGSLALTGKGHGTDAAILMGLEGKLPISINPDDIPPRLQQIQAEKQIHLANMKKIEFNYCRDLLFHYDQTLPFHTNGICFKALNHNQEILLTKIYYSVGSGFIVKEEEIGSPNNHEKEIPFPFETAQELMIHCHNQNLSITDIMLANEQIWRDTADIHNQLLDIAHIMLDCIQTGCTTEGILPGGLNVKRMAPVLYKKLIKKGKPPESHPDIINWLNVFAMAVNEQNAAGGKVVPAPTNGAAGIIPAVLNYYQIFCEQASPEGVITFLFTAGAIAILYKKGASLSGTEVGCQGEVGVACSMAAGALTAALGGTPKQIEKAAAIGMEHNLGLTCDPIGGLVQIPCIERNAMGAVKAVNAARLVLAEDEGETTGEHIVTLDNVIKTMHQIGKDMMPIYKETSLGGLAKQGGVTVNMVEC